MAQPRRAKGSEYTLIHTALRASACETSSQRHVHCLGWKDVTWALYLRPSCRFCPTNARKFVLILASFDSSFVISAPNNARPSFPHRFCVCASHSSRTLVTNAKNLLYRAHLPLLPVAARGPSFFLSNPRQTQPYRCKSPSRHRHFLVDHPVFCLLLSPPTNSLCQDGCRCFCPRSFPEAPRSRG